MEMKAGLSDNPIPCSGLSVRGQAGSQASMAEISAFLDRNVKLEADPNLNQPTVIALPLRTH
jgi:hypothetical protein